jgi:LysM repeat protein
VVYNFDTPPEVKRRGMSPRPPRSPDGFVGRVNELNLLEQSIKDNGAVLVHGHEGIGKTALARKAANSDPAKDKPDGVVFLEAVEDTGKLLGYQDVIQILFDAFFESTPPLKVEDTTARTYLSNTEPLILLDRFELPVTSLKKLPDVFPGGSLIVTGQNAGLNDSFEPIQLSPLTRNDSIQLLSRKSGLVGDPATSRIPDQICNLLGDIPLAITIIANIIKMNRIGPAEAIDALKKIQSPSQDKTQAAIEKSFGLAYTKLYDNERVMLAQTAAAPGISIDRAWLESMAGGKPTSEALESLELLQANSPRLGLPAGLRQVLQSGRGDIRSLRQNLFNHLTGELKSRSLDFEFVGDELGNILGLLQWASNENRWSEVITMGKAVDPYLAIHGLWGAWETVLKQILLAAIKLKDEAVEAWVLHQLGSREIGVGVSKQAVNLLVQALRIRESIGDEVGAAYTRHNLNIILPPDPTDRSKEKPRPPQPFRSYIYRWEERGWAIPFLLYGIFIAAVIFLLASYTSLALAIKSEASFFKATGQDINYTFNITNRGIRRLDSPVSVTDDRMKVSCPKVETIGNLDGFFNWNESMTCTAEYAVTEEDIKLGSITNKASARAGEVNSRERTFTVYFSDLFLTRTAAPGTYKDAGQIITYTYTVTNRGKLRLNGPMKVVGDKLTNINCPGFDSAGNRDRYLDGDETITCNAEYRIAVADIKNGSVIDIATASTDGIDSDPVPYTISVENPGKLTLSGSVDHTTFDEVGQVINYTYVVSNSGKSSVEGPVAVIDDIDQTAINCPDVKSIGNLNPSLDPNLEESVTCTSLYTTTQTDLDNSLITNIAEALAGNFRSNPVSLTISAIRNPEIQLTKTAAPATYGRVGQTITYTYVITNTGNITIPPSDDGIDNEKAFTCGADGVQLVRNETITCSASYTITLGDIDAGSVIDTARASIKNTRISILSQPATTTVTFVCPPPPSGWEVYIVRSGDTLSRISSWYGIPPTELQEVNCKGSSTTIRAGEGLYVPYLVDIGGIVFYDTNMNSTRDSGEQGVPGFRVRLMDENGNVISETETNASGQYEFLNMPPFNYRVNDAPVIRISRDTGERNFAVVPVPYP